MKRILIAMGILFVTAFSFSQKPVTNYYSIPDFSEDKAKSIIQSYATDPMEGIWQSSDGFKYAIIKYKQPDGTIKDDKFEIVILSHNTDNAFWKENYVKGFIEKTAATGAYNIDYYTAGKKTLTQENYYTTNTTTYDDIQVQTCIGLLESFSLFTFTKQNGDKILLVKLFPKTDENDNNTSYSSSDYPKATGTGFAISANGFIVTNYHVIEKAKTIEVKGLDGNFNKKYKAEVAVSDENGDLAIIKIKDPSFSSLGNIPYTIRQNLAEVGENVFVLGYPLTSSMGQEVKLTNGIVSSRTGFQGDISRYQISAPVQPGNSGGPMFDKNGNLAGIVCAKHLKAENASYAIKASYLKNLIELLPTPISFPSLNLLNGKPLTEQVKLASNYTYLIIINDNDEGSGSSENNFSNQHKANSSKTRLHDLYDEAKQNAKDKDYDRAIEKLNEIIESEPDNIEVIGYRGYVYLYGIHNYDKAIQDFTKLIQMKPEDKRAYNFRGNAYRSAGKDLEAIKDFTEYLKGNEDDVNTYFIRALCKSHLGDRAGAIRDYDEIISREKKDTKTKSFLMATVYNNKGYSLFELGKSDEALAMINKGLELAPKESYIWGSRGELYYKKGEFKKAIKDMDQGISLYEEKKSYAKGEDNSILYYIRGLSKIKLGQKEEGCADLTKAGELGSKDAYQAIKESCQ